MKRLLLLLLLLTPVNSKVIIYNPRANDVINRGLLIVNGVTDESVNITLQLYNPLNNELITIGEAEPDSNGFWNKTINTTGLSGDSYYVIANSLLDKSSVLFNLVTELITKLSVNNPARGEELIINATIVRKYGTKMINSVIVSLIDNNSPINLTLIRSNDLFTGSIIIPYDWSIGVHHAFINQSLSDALISSDNIAFNVSPAIINLSLINPLMHNLGLTNLMIKSPINNDVINALIRKPSGEFNTQLINCGDYYCKDLLFDETGEWSIIVNQSINNNTLLLNKTLIVSDELIASLLNNNFMINDELIINVSVKGINGLVNPHFIINGLPFSINNVINDQPIYSLILNGSLPAGKYPFNLFIFDDNGNNAELSGELIINDLIINCCFSDNCISESSIIDSLSNAECTVKLTNNSFVNGYYKAYSDGELISEGLFNKTFILNNIPNKQLMLIINANGLTKTLIITPRVRNNLFPSLIIVNKSVTKLLVNESFKLLSSPDWITQLSDYLIINSTNLTNNPYFVNIKYLINDELFNSNLTIIVNKRKSYGNLTISDLIIDLNNSGIIIKAVNTDAVNHTLLINSSRQFNVSVSAFNQSIIFIPFNNLTSNMSLITGDSVLMNINPQAINGLISEEVVRSDNNINYWLLIGYPIIALGCLMRKRYIH